MPGSVFTAGSNRSASAPAWARRIRWGGPGADPGVRRFLPGQCLFPQRPARPARLDYKLDFDRALLAFLSELPEKEIGSRLRRFQCRPQGHRPGQPQGRTRKIRALLPRSGPGWTRFIAAGFIDTFRLFNQEPGQYSWWSYRFNARARNIGWRIDYFCVDAKSKARVKDAAILPEVMGSDHCPVRLDFL